METLGDTLRAAREKQGISVKDVEKATSIRAIYIQAIEDGNYGILPGEVYLKGFIRNYANFLNLDGQEMVNQYRQSQAPEVAAPTEPVKADRKKTTDKSGSGSNWLTIAVVVVLLGGAAGLALFYLNAPSPSTPPPKPAPQAQNQPAQPVPPPAAQKPPTLGTPAAPAVPGAPAAPAARPLVIVAKYTEPAWTFVTVDGKSVYEGIPKVGETLTWRADRNVVIKVGNGQGVDVTVNGQPQGKLGSDGEVVEKTYSAGAAATNIQKP